MSKPTSETLRELAEKWRSWNHLDSADEADAHADAWEKAEIEKSARIDTLQCRVKQLRKDRQRACDLWRKILSERDALMVLSGDDADGLANTCHQFQGELVHKQDEFGARFWREMEIRLRKFAEARRKIEEKP
jgi:hypothetical protein